ncbi:MAG: T9SS type A sorting domain-containing protein, partial [FCB group bacterium]|nr:T9SS type A sorting domain-containing protein [FCB group bacterium]
MEEFTLDNCAISTGTGFSEFNDGIEFLQYVTVTYEDLQDSLCINWESDVIRTYYDDGNGLEEIDNWSFAPVSYWFNSINSLYSGQSLRRHEPMMDYEFLLKDSNIEDGLRTRGILEGYVYDLNDDQLEGATIEFYRDENWLENIFPPIISNSIGFYSSEIYAKNYEVSICLGSQVLVDTFLTIEPDSTTFIEFYTDYNPSSSDDYEISLPSSYYNLSNYPNPFNPTTEISFSIPQTSSSVTIEIYNSRGQKIKTLDIPNSSSQNPNQITWNGTNENNKQVPSGVYLYKLVSNGRELAANKMLLLK